MLKNTLKALQNTKTILNINNNSKATFHTSTTFREKWDLLTAILIERKPVICPELGGLEKEFKEYLSAVEFERSLKNDTEISLEKEREAITQKKDVDDIELTAQQTTQDFIDACKEELAKFKFADRITEADKSNDVTSLKRKLDKHLVCVLNQKIGNQSHYMLPQGKREAGETLRQCAERVVKQQCGDDIKVYIFGNAPCGFYKYRYPKSVRNEDVVGAKIFIYFARYSSGQITQKEGADYKWLDKSELKNILPETYRKSVLPILFD